MIEVVSALVIRDGRILLTQRRADNAWFPLYWESPGGKVDGNESHHEAVMRELREELGVEVPRHTDVWQGVPKIAQQPLWCGKIDRADGEEIFVLLYETELAGEPMPLEGQGIGWFTEREMRFLTLTPANAQAADRVIHRLRKGSK